MTYNIQGFIGDGGGMKQKLVNVLDRQEKKNDPILKRVG